MGLRKKPSMGEVWIISGTTYCIPRTVLFLIMTFRKKGSHLRETFFYITKGRRGVTSPQVGAHLFDIHSILHVDMLVNLPSKYFFSYFW